jgi:hypothetical protein
VTLIAVVLVANRSFLVVKKDGTRSRTKASGDAPSDIDPSAQNPDGSVGGIDPCAFRSYPPHRYYRLYDTTPDFLRHAEYIYGEWPALLPLLAKTTSSAVPHKLCVDQASWLPPGSIVSLGRNGQKRMAHYPFADGTNPSLLSMERIRAARNPTKETSDFIRDVERLSIDNKKRIKYVATACMTNSQCVWGSPTPATFSNETAPRVVLTTLLLLDTNFGTVAQATIRLKRDGPWGKMPAPPKQQQPQPVYHTPALDDARLFVHAGRIWVSYREGRGFGYETQVLNPVRASIDLQKEPARALHAEIWASETASFCCGRNMALMESGNATPADPQLLSLTWVDPVTVIEVDTTPHVVSSALSTKKKNGNAQAQRRKLQQQQQVTKSRTSHVHGNNAFMVRLPHVDEFLGVAHFHRPHDRKPNAYAKFGHHYTHALYTVSASPPYELRRLSAEFVLPQAAKPAAVPAPSTTTNDAEDAEIIQFASGLEVVGDKRIIIAYGINDCEAAIAEVSLEEAMTHWLRPVQPGTQVVDVMMPLKAP